MATSDYYALLGVKRDATAAELKAAYRKKVKLLHPDRNKAPNAEKTFKEFQAAYEVLKDPEKRKKYDLYGENWDAPQSAPAPPPFARGSGGEFENSPLWKQFFGDIPFGSNTPFDDSFGAAFPLEQELPISLDEAVRGGKRTLQIEARRIEVTIPPGMENGAALRLQKQVQGRDLVLYMVVEPSQTYQLANRNIVGEVSVPDHIAALGGEVELTNVPTGPLRVNIPADSHTGQTLRLRGKGLPARGKHPVGDLLLTIRIIRPQGITLQERECYERLREMRHKKAS